MKQKISAGYTPATPFSDFLKKLTIKNYFDYLLFSEEGFTDYQLFTLLQKGGAL